MKVLITGGTGLLGRALMSTVANGTQVSVLHRREYRLGGIVGEQLIVDLADENRVKDLFDQFQFDLVIHAAGIASVDYVEQHYEEAWRSNITATEHVLDAVRKKDIRFVYISSNAVFDGYHPPYREDDSLNPLNRYGQIKAECEQMVRRRCPEAAIVRPILMYGWPFPQGRPNPATWIIDRLQRGDHVSVVTDVQENPLWFYHCAEAIWRMIDRNMSGTIHLAGKDTVSRYEFARLVARMFELDETLIHPVDSSFFPTIAPRPRNTSFVTERMERELGLEPLSLEEGLRRMRALSSSSAPPRSPSTP